MIAHALPTWPRTRVSHQPHVVTFFSPSLSSFPVLESALPPYNTPAPLSCSLSHTLPDTPPRRNSISPSNSTLPRPITLISQ